jgi:hypothetical protein
MKRIKKPRPIKRRTKLQTAELCAKLRRIVEENRPATCRQIFYRAVSEGIIPKTEAAYKNIVIRLLARMRLNGTLPFDWIADNTRWMRKPTTFSSLASALHHTQAAYRRCVWDNQDCYVEVWLEKDALSGVLYQVTRKWDVPLMVTRGYASLSYLHSAAEAIQAEGKPSYIYYFGDHDPSGVDIPRNVEARLREFAPKADITFVRVAVNVEQIKQLNLQTRPTKKTDSRGKNFEGESVEVDAIPPEKLREMVERCISQHIDLDEYDKLKNTEQLEKETLNEYLSNFPSLLSNDSNDGDSEDDEDE